MPHIASRSAVQANEEKSCKMEGNQELEIPLSEIEPLRCQRPEIVRDYIGMLEAGKKPPLIWAWRIKQPHRVGSKN
jgi:hypothetical protein